MRSKLISTGLAQLIIQFGSAWFLFVSAVYFSVEDFGSYQVARRAISLVAFPALLGTGLSVPRLVAMSTGGSNQRRDSILRAGLTIVTPGLLIFVLAWLISPGDLGAFFFGTGQTGALANGLLLSVVGLCLHTLAYGYLRGNNWLGLASSLAIVNMVVVPFLALGSCRADPGLLLTLNGLGWIVVAGAVLISNLRPCPKNLSVDRLVVREMLAYGVPRVPGEFAQFGLAAVPVLIVNRLHGSTEAGFLSFAISVMVLASSLFDFLNIWLLPHLSRLFCEGRWQESIRELRRATVVVLVGAGFVAAVASLVISEVVARFLDSSYREAVPHARLLLLAVVPYSVFKTQRTGLDALCAFPFGSLSLIVGLAVVSLGTFCLTSVHPASVVTLSFVLVGATQFVACEYVFRRAGWNECH